MTNDSLGPLDDVSPLPLKHQAYAALRGALLAGRWPAGELLPAERELQARLSVSRITIRAAMERLVADGLVARRRGAGTVSLCSAPPRREPLRGLIENLITMGLRTEVRLLADETRAAPDGVADALGLPRGAPARYTARVRSHGGGAFSHLTTWLPTAVADRCRLDALGSRPLLTILEDAGFRIAAAEQWITAAAAAPDVALALDVDEGAPLVDLTRVVRDVAGAPVEHLRALYRPDRYAFAMSLERGEGVDAGRWRAGL